MLTVIEVFRNKIQLDIVVRPLINVSVCVLGDPVECGSYRGIKLLEHAMKVVERIFEHRIRQLIEVDDMQFGFMTGKGTMPFFLL